MGKAQAILGTANDALLVLSSWGNAKAWESVLAKPNLWNTVSLGTSYYGVTKGIINDVQSLKK